MSKDDKSFMDDFIDLVDSAGKGAKQNMDDSLRRNGYENFSDFVNTGFDSAYGGTKMRKPYSPYSGVNIETRYEYVMTILENMMYPKSLGDSYLKGYQSVINFYKEKMPDRKNDLNYFENGIRKDIKQFRNQYKNNRSRYILGQVDALEFILNELTFSKQQLMHRIQYEARL